jgi:hypothetical protein
VSEPAEGDKHRLCPAEKERRTGDEEEAGQQYRAYGIDMFQWIERNPSQPMSSIVA